MVGRMRGRRPFMRSQTGRRRHGIVSNPYVRRSRTRRTSEDVCFTASLPAARPFANQRVLVVGAGNSSGEISAELAGAGAQVTVAIRSGARVVPRALLGIPVQYIGAVLDTLPPPVLRSAMQITSALSGRFRGESPLPPPTDNPCAAVPLIGFHLSDGVKSGRIQLQRGLLGFTTDGVRFSDGSEQPFDTVILATGYRAALGMLGPSLTLDRCGFGERQNRVISVDSPDLYFVGHTRSGRRPAQHRARCALPPDSSRTGRVVSRTQTETPPRSNER